MGKKFIIFSIVLGIISGICNFVYATDNAEKCEVIVLTECDESGFQAITESYFSKTGERIETEQKYSVIFDGFSTHISLNNIDILKGIKNVKNVNVSKPYSIPDYEEGEAPSVSFFSLSEPEYTGKGTLIAVLDGGFMLSHEIFSGIDETSIRYSKDDMAEIYTAKSLNVEEYNIGTAEEEKYVSNEDTWRSNKVPFAFDYCGEDTDVYASNVSHGTMVASAAAGNSSSYKGSAPDAQLALFKIGSDTGGISPATVLTALEDAIELGVDAINMSLGSMGDYYGMDSFKAAADKCNELGIGLYVAAGNSAYSGKSNRYGTNLPSVLNPDYGAVSDEAAQDYVMSVGATTDIYMDGDNGTMADFTGYGVTAGLKLSPKISYKGMNVNLASQDSNSTYASAKGTSFSTPLSSGFYAAFKEYVDTKEYEFDDNAEKNRFINQAFMSTAQIVRKNGIPYTPRVQGAGCLGLYNAMNTDVVIEGSDGMSNVNLFEVGDSFDIKFKLHNYGNDDVTYNISGEMITDGYKEVNGRYYVNLSPVSVNAEFKADQITVEAKGTKEVTVKVTPDNNFLTSNKEIFENGFFLEGYITLTPVDSSVKKLNFPYMGYYGDWDSIPIFDTEDYFGKTGFADSKKNSLRLNDVSGKMIDTTYFNPVSINIQIANLRHSRDNNIYFTGKEFNDSLPLHANVNKTFYYQGALYFYRLSSIPALSLGIFTTEGGEYTATYTAVSEYDKETTQTYTQNLIMDSIAPSISAVKRVVKNNKVYLNVSASDAGLLQYIKIEAVDGSNLVSAAIDLKSLTKEYDISDNPYSLYKITVYDYAENKTEYIESDENLTSYMIAYDEYGVLSGVKTADGLVDLTEAETLYNSLNNDKASEIKLFVFDNKLNPYTPVKNYIIK